VRKIPPCRLSITTAVTPRVHVPTVVERHAADDVAERHAEQHGDAVGRQREEPVPHGAPARALALRAELDGDRAQDEHEQHEHHRQVEPAEQRGVHERERGEQRTAAEDEPHLVAVPHRPDAVEEDALVAVVLGEHRREHPDAQVEAVEDHVAADDRDVEHEPQRVEPHVSDLPSRRRCRWPRRGDGW
jgi:hypothetical protein